MRTDDPDARFAPGSVLRTDPAERGPLTVTDVHPRSGGLVVAFAGVGDRESAEALRGTVLVVDSDSLPPMEAPDEWYDHELVGLAVRRPGGGGARARSRTSCTRPAPTCSWSGPTTGGSIWCRSSASSCRRSTCRAAGSWWRRRRGSMTCDGPTCDGSR